MPGVWFALTVPTAAYEQKLRADLIQAQQQENNSDINKEGYIQQNTEDRENDHSGETTRILRMQDQSNEKREPTAAATTSIASVLTQTLNDLNVKDVVWSLSSNDNFYQVTFPSDKHDCEDVLRELRIIGIGSSLETKLNVLPCTLQFSSQENEREAYPLETDAHTDAEPDGESKRGLLSKKSFLQSIKSRLTVAQVVAGVRDSAVLTFDFIMFVLLAGMLAAIGLVENSSVVLVAAMLVSPMMGPILAGTFGTVIHDRQLQLLGVKNELIGLALCLLFGGIFGLIYGSIEHWSDGFWLTEEMIARGSPRSLWIGVLIALPSGAGVALSVLGGNAGCLVGVAISASLLPPVVNTGILWAVSLTKYIASCVYYDDTEYLTAPEGYNPIYSNNMAIEALGLGFVSLCLTLVNISCIFLTGLIVLKIKEVAPDRRVPEMKRFWQTDIKAVRNYNITVGVKEAGDLLAGIQKELKGSDQETSKQFRECMKEIANDPVYKTVRRKTMYRVPKSSVQSTWHFSRDGANETRKRTASTSHLPDLAMRRSLGSLSESQDEANMSPPLNMEPRIGEDVVFKGLGTAEPTMSPSSHSKRLGWSFFSRRSERRSQHGRFSVTPAEDHSHATGILRQSKRRSNREQDQVADLYDLDELVP